jgi:hypothetical protein
MRPIKYIVEKGVVYFHYSLSDLKLFVARGKTYGDAGMIITRRKGNTLTYKGYGTIDNPRVEIYVLTINWFEPFDGPLLSDVERLK